MKKGVFSLIALLSLSCGDAIETREIGQSKKALVFGQRNVEQVRGTMSRASSEAEGSDERDYAYQAAQLARATATVYTIKPKTALNCSQDRSAASATLTSDSRLVGTFHAPHGAVESMQAFFESESFSPNPSGSAVGAIRADASASLYNPNWEATTAHRSDEVEESPFLANRLFSLGLDRWASQGPGTDARIGLRSGFYFDLDSIGPQQTGYQAGTIGGQGFVSQVPNGDYQGRDIAVLRTVQNTKINSVDFAVLPSGSFAVKKPAVFFGKVRMGAIDEHPIKSVNFLNHTTSWPDSESQAPGSKDYLVPLTSFSATYDNLQGSVTSNICDGTQLVNFTADHLFQTTFDAIAFSSGGMVLTPHNLDRAQYHTKRPLIGMGILKGATVPENSQINHRIWEQPVPQTLPTNTHATNITGTQPQDIVIFERDTTYGSGDPSHPIPIIEGNDPECKTHNGDFCTSFVTTPPEGGGESGPKRPEGVEIVEGAEAEKPGGGFGRRFFCPGYGIGKPPGIMVGIHGGLALNGIGVEETAETIKQNGGGIGSFMGICAPYSSRPYTDNWRFLYIKGAQMDRSIDTLGGPLGWGSFDRYQSRVYEERLVEDEVQVRPPSTKMCPPNYLLRGVELSFEQNGQYYSGVKTIYCAKGTPSADGPDELALSLVEDESNYTLAGKPFDLTQNIGYPDSCTDECCQGECLGITCQGNEVVAGFETFHDNVGRLIHLDARCIKNPYQ